MLCSRRHFVSTIVVATLCATSLEAAPTKATTVYIKDMHCAACAKKIAGKLYTVRGVLKVTTDVNKGVAVIVTRPAEPASPKAIWQAVEDADFKPIKIASPLGDFTKKPRR